TDRQSISKVFKVLDNHLESFLYYLSIIRNFSAHGNRLYCLRTTRPLIDTDIHENLSIPIRHGEYINGKRDLFAAVIALRYLVSVNEFNRFKTELSGTINKLSSRLDVISIDEVMSCMGFPPTWKDIMQREIKL
ncbi:MAG: Abi family protein, partial [Clostridia bacterium]|nr:Abi family protein [Clostridia bacterium]